MSHESQPVISVGIDRSVADKSDLDWAIDIARRTGSRLRLVIATTLGGSVKELKPWAEYVSAREPGLALTAAAYPSTEPHRMVADVLACESSRSQLLVVNQSRHHDALGQLGERAAADCRCPVVVVPEKWQTPSRAGHLTIVLGLGKHRRYEDTTRFAFEFADSVHATLRIVHAWQYIPTAGLSFAQATQDYRLRQEEQRRQITEAMQRWVDKFPNVVVHQNVVCGDTVSVLRLNMRQADLLVLGHRSRSRIGNAIFGRIGGAVLREALVPVVLVPKA